MWFHYTITVPAGTLESAPVEKTLKLTHGIVSWLGIPWQHGPNSLVYVRILRFRHQIFPMNLDEAACGDGFIEGGKEYLELTEPPYTLVASAYSPECTHDHDVTILINVLPRKIVDPLNMQLELQPRRIPWPI